MNVTAAVRKSRRVRSQTLMSAPLNVAVTAQRPSGLSSTWLTDACPVRTRGVAGSYRLTTNT